VTVLSARTSIAARVYHRSGGAGPGHDHDPDPAPRKADELDRRAQPAPSHRTHPPAVDVHPGADPPTTPRLPEPGSLRPTARQRDARSRLARGPDQRWPQDQAPDEAWPSLKWHSTAAPPSTRTRVRRPVRRHDHLEEVELQPAAPVGCQQARRCQRRSRSQGDETRASSPLAGALSLSPVAVAYVGCRPVGLRPFRDGPALCCV
jgi:hypothetical protein